MNELWFDPNRWAWLPGTALGVTLGLWGAAAGTLAPFGRGKTAVMTAGWVVLAAAAVALVVGLAALAAGQPFAVWFFLALPGFQGVPMMAIFLPLVLHRYRQAEGRKMQAEDLGLE